jgi:glycosyltransferase involved in cell wall biosynthesis
MTPLISIIIPTLNEEKYLPRLLADLEKQKEQNFEVIVVDAKSDDKTKENALVYAKKFPFQFVESTKRNHSYQRNLGVSKSRGKYIFFLDADSGISSEVTEKIAMYCRKEKKLLYLTYPKPSPNKLSYKIIFFFSVGFVRMLDVLGKGLAFGPGMVIERSLFEKIGGFDEKAYVSEDQNLVIKSREAGIRARFLSDVFYSYSMRRFEDESLFVMVVKYCVFILITVFKGVVYTRAIQYKYGKHGEKSKTI